MCAPLCHNRPLLALPHLKAVAKAIHVPVRRREEAATAPTMAVRAAAVNLAVVLRRNFDFQVSARVGCEKGGQAGRRWTAEVQVRTEPAYLCSCFVHFADCRPLRLCTRAWRTLGPRVKRLSERQARTPRRKVRCLLAIAEA